MRALVAEVARLGDIGPGVPVVPIVIAGTAGILRKHGFVLSSTASCHIKALPPVAPQQFGGDVAALRDHVRELIAREKARLDALPRAQ